MTIHRGTTLTVSVDSKIVGQPAARLLERASTIPLRGIETVELCLRRIEDVDVALVSAVVRLHGALAASGRSLRLVNASESVLSLLRTVGVTHSIAVSPRSADYVHQESGLHPLF
jgi:ABC-type transporter Mla MlaB component